MGGDMTLQHHRVMLATERVLANADTSQPGAASVCSRIYSHVNGANSPEHELQLFVRDDRSVYAPNTFTPNGDGNNDYFMIYATDDYLEIKAFRVFDRWGELVYINDSAILNQTSDGWDGTFRNIELQSAVYIWYAELLDDKGNIELLKGDIFLHR